jgi:hypothetical protein
VLYLFRSPSTVKVGRQAIEPEVREALEHTHPDLSFDWDALLREPAVTRSEPRERAQRPGRRDETRRGADLPVAVVIEDESLLGRTLGVAEAAGLRRRYAELLERITRRARTPEERDRLTDRLQRLNPDDWPDEPAIRAGSGTADAEWEAIDLELPQRRRGRRGGRLDERPAAPASAAEPSGEDASGIISGEGDSNESAELDAGPVGQTDDVPRPGDGGGLGADAGSLDDPDADGPDADAGADDPGLPRGNGDHLD